LKLAIWSGSHIIKKADFKEGLKALKSFGFDYTLSKEVAQYACESQEPLLPFLAGNDKIKKKELLKIIQNKDIFWLMAARGGYGCLRLLEDLDKEAIPRTHDFHIWGYSDLTVLQLYFWQRKAWPYVQGPMIGSDSLIKASSKEVKILQNIAKFGIFPSKFKISSLVKKHQCPSKKKFLFIGGNFSSIVSMLGTPWEPKSRKDYLLFLEDILEPAYKCDRLLTQLRHSRFFERCKGIVLGHFTDCPDYKSVFTQFSQETKIPIYLGIPMGHEKPRVPLMFGVEVFIHNGHLQYENPTTTA
jgi:muramoyltetrapeptide carboxypeptidase